jgi:putative cardiolipin synthase
LEGVHEKLFLVDEKALIVTGRGIGEQYLRWLDTAFAVRGALVAQAQQVFDAVWDEARRHQRPYRGYLGGPTQPPPLATPYQAPALEEWIRWFLAPPGPPIARGRILHHDFLRQIHAIDPVPADVGSDERLARLDDPVVAALVARLATARSVRISLLSTILHPALKRALVDACRRGASVTLFINTAAPRLDDSRKPIVARGSVWVLELPDLDDLLAAGAVVRGFQIRPGRPWLFLHRKLAIIDGVVFLGSHNLNLPSTLFFDEASFEVESAPLAAGLARLFDDDLAANGEPLDAARVHRERMHAKSRLLRWMSIPYLGYM